MTSSKILVFSGLAAILAIGTAQATIISGSGTFTDTGSSANQLNFTGAVKNSDITNLNLSVNTPVTFTNFLNIDATDTAAAFIGTSTRSDSIATTFVFTLPTAATGSVTGTGTDSTFSLGGVVFFSNGTVAWANPGVVDFTDGAILDITLGTTSFITGGTTAKNIGVSATFNLIKAPTPVPEPGTFMLLGTALAGLGLVLRRRRKS